jgi:hypothetical protein
MTTIDRGVRIDGDRISGIRRALQTLLNEKISELSVLASSITILQLQIDEMPDTLDLSGLPYLSGERHTQWEQ